MIFFGYGIMFPSAFALAPLIVLVRPRGVPGGEWACAALAFKAALAAGEVKGGLWGYSSIEFVWCLWVDC